MTRDYPTFGSYLGVLVRHRRLIIALGFVGAAAFTVLGIVGQQRWVTGAALLPQESQGLTPSVSGLPIALGQLAGVRASSGTQFYARLLLSDELLRSVVERRYGALEDHENGASLAAYLGIPLNGAESGDVMDAVDRLRGRLSVRVEDRPGLVSFEVELGLRPLVIAVAEELLEQLRRYNQENRQSQARAERGFLEARVAEAKRELEAFEDRHVEFLRRNVDIRTSPALQAEEARLAREVARMQALVLTLSERYELARVEEVRDTPVLTVIEHPDRVVRPVSRQLPLRLIGGGAAGVLLGIGLAFVLDAARAAGVRDLRSARRALEELPEPPTVRT